MSWLYYLLESNLYLTLLYALYYLLLRKETFYQLNRAYLLLSTMLAFTIPLMQLGILRAPIPQLHYAITVSSLPDAINSPVTRSADTAPWTADNYYMLIYGAITLVLLAIFIIKICRLIILSRANKVIQHEDFKLIEVPSENDAFSFFNYLFIGSGLKLSPTILQHEMIHIRQRHSWDILYLEVLKIINWFNPVMYLLQGSMKEVHEFIADNETVCRETNVSVYTDFLVKNAYGLHENMLTNNFFNKNLLKNRIKMLHQKKSGNAARLKFLLLLPLTGSLLCASTLAFAKSYGWVDIIPGGIASQKVLIPSTKNNTNTVKANPSDDPIPVLSKGSIGFMLNPGNYTYKTLSDMASKFHRKGYKMDFDEYKEGANPMLKISLKKLDAAPNSGTSATFSIDELKRTGHVIFIGADKSKNLLYVHSQKIFFPKPKVMKDTRKENDSAVKEEPKVILKKADTNDKVVKVERLPHQPVKKIDTTGNVVKVERFPHQSSNKLPPPSGYSSGFSTLYTYLGKHLRYPAKYFEQKTVDNVIVEFTTGADYKVSGVKIKNNAMPLFADEVTRQLQAYTDTVNRAPGTYFFLVQFSLISEKHTRTWLPSSKYLDLTGKPDCAGNIEIVGYVKED